MDDDIVTRGGDMYQVWDAAIVCECVNVCLYVCMRARARACVCVCVCVCVQMYVPICTCVCISAKKCE